MKQRVPLPYTKHNRLSFSPGEIVVLFGAGIFAAPVIHALGQRGIIPVCLCDNAAAKVGADIFGIPVIAPAEAREKYPDSTVIVTAAPAYHSEIQLQLAAMGWQQIFDCSSLLAAFDYDRNSFACGVSALHYDLDRFFYEYFLKHHPEKLVIPSLDIVITEKCSLKCRDCSNLMQYYTHPKDADFDRLFVALDVLMESVDHVLEFRVLGGETFMNRHAHRYVNRMRQYEKHTRIAVYSNGTIVPTGENLRCLMHDDTYLRVTNYGVLSGKMREIADLFDANGVVYDVQSVDGWQDCAVIAKRDRTQKELEDTYRSCCANNTLTLMDSRLYICPFAANADNLGALPDFPDDVLQLNNRSGRQELRDRLFDMLRSRRSFSACAYCAGRPIGTAPLPAAVQTDTPLPYKTCCKGEG
jgi:hypothetical protein